MIQTNTSSASHSLHEVRDALGPPAYEGKDVLLYQGDCLALMEKLPPLIVDLTVTSPPYNIGKEYEHPMPLSQYLDWSGRWIGSVYRLTKTRGSFWLNLGYLAVEGKARAIPLPYLLWSRIPFFLMQEIVWHYGAGVACKNAFSPRNEKFLWYVKSPNEYLFNLDDIRDPNVKYPNQKKNGKLRCNPAGKNPGDVWIFPKVTSGRDRSSKERTVHPAQFPLAVIDRIIKASSADRGLILDPFAGSATTLEAALRRGRPVIGFELSSSYISAAIERLESFRRNAWQASLF